MLMNTGVCNSDSSKPGDRPQVLVLTPVFNEKDNLERYVREVQNTLLSVDEYAFRFLFIDDGSSDDSWSRIKAICAADFHFSGIRLSRNFGAHTALSAGFAHDIADAICTLAADLQDPPSIILSFLHKWRQGARIVWGKRRSRKDRTWRILVSNLFYIMIKRYAMPKSSMFTTGSFFLIDRKVAEHYRLFKEQNRITFALVAWTGFDQAVVEYDRVERRAGTTGWSFGKMLKAMYDTFIGFSPLPIKLMTATGIGISTLAFLLLGYVILSTIAGNPLPGWTSLMATNTFFFGLLFFFLGIVGEYLYRIYAEAVRRPLYFISDACGCSDRNRLGDNQP